MGKRFFENLSGPNALGITLAKGPEMPVKAC